MEIYKKLYVSFFMLWLVFVTSTLMGCTQRSLAMKNRHQPAQEIADTSHDEHEFYRFSILCIDNIMLLPNTRFVDLLKLLNGDKEKVQSYLEPLTINTLNKYVSQYKFTKPVLQIQDADGKKKTLNEQEMKDLIESIAQCRCCTTTCTNINQAMAMQATKVEKVLEERRILDKADQEVQKFIQTHTRTFVNTAMNNSTMTYGAYMWGIEKSKQSIRTKIENILEQFNIKKSTPIRRKRCAECSNIIRRSAEFDKIVSSILSNESISNRLMMKLFANDTVDKETTNVSIYSFEIPLDDLRVLYKQLDSKSNDDVTKLYQNYLLSKMENLSMAESTFQDFLTQGYINPLDDPALMAQLEEISIQSSNHQCKSTKAKNKKNKQTNLKHQQTKQSPKTGRGDKVASESTETYNYNIQQELIELAQSSYGLDPRVRKWSKPLDKLLGYFKNPKSSYDAQFTEINKDRNRVMEEKIRHDIIPIQYLLDRPDATNYFITKGNTRSAAVRLEVGHARKEYGMVDITIDTTDEKPVIYHQMFRKAKPEETLRFFAPNVGDKDNVEEDDNYVYEGRSIVKNISNQSYIITIPDGDAKLSKKLYVLPYRLNSALG